MSSLKARVAKYQSKIIEKKCIECGELFMQKRTLLSVCDDCKPIRAKRIRPQTFKNCEYCSKYFGPVNHLSAKYCSKKCSNNGLKKEEKIIRKTISIAKNAQSLLAYHIKAGNIQRPSICEFCLCSNKKIEGAHKDYAKPLDVKWLCRSCHVKWDKKFPKNATYIVGKKATLESTGQTYDELLKEQNA